MKSSKGLEIQFWQKGFKDFFGNHRFIGTAKSQKLKAKSQFQIFHFLINSDYPLEEYQFLKSSNVQAKANLPYKFFLCTHSSGVGVEL